MPSQQTTSPSHVDRKENEDNEDEDGGQTVSFKSLIDMVLLSIIVN